MAGHFPSTVLVDGFPVRVPVLSHCATLPFGRGGGVQRGLGAKQLAPDMPTHCTLAISQTCLFGICSMSSFVKHTEDLKIAELFHDCSMLNILADSSLRAPYS